MIGFCTMYSSESCRTIMWTICFSVFVIPTLRIMFTSLSTRVKNVLGSSSGYIVTFSSCWTRRVFSASDTGNVHSVTTPQASRTELQAASFSSISVLHVASKRYCHTFQLSRTVCTPCILSKKKRLLQLIMSVPQTCMVLAASHPIPSPDCNHASKCIVSTTLYSQGFRFLYRHIRRRLGNPWVRPINAALKHLKLATVTPGATSTLSTSYTFLFLCRCSDAFPSSFTHAAINLQPLSRAVLYQAPEPSAVVFQPPVIPNSRRSSATQSVHSFSFPLGPRFSVFSNSPDMTLFGNTCGHPCGAAPPTTTTSSCARLFRCSRIRFTGGRLCRRGYACSATCTRLSESKQHPMVCCAELGVVALQGVHISNPYRRASTTSDFTIRAFRGS